MKRYNKCVKGRMAAFSVAVFYTLFLAEADAQEQFATWVSANQGSIDQSVPAISQRALNDGFDVVYGGLRAEAVELKELPNISAIETRWIDNYLLAMDSSIIPDRVEATTALNDIGPLTRNSRAAAIGGNEVVRSACDKVRQVVRNNPFNPIEDPNTGVFIILETRNSPEEEIRIDRDEGGKVAQELWRLAFQWGGAIANTNAQCMTVTAQAISEASGRWNNFMTNVAGDQFMWETLINGWLGARVDSLAGTLAYPPEWQLRIVHPEPVMVVSTEGSTEFKPRIAIEALGYRSFGQSDEYRARNGLSLVVILPASSDEKTGYGLLYTRRTATFGIASQKIAGQGNVVSLVFGMTLADRLENTSKKLKERRDLIEGQFKAISDAIDDCRSDVIACGIGN